MQHAAGSWLATARAVLERQGEMRLSQVAAGVAFWLVIAAFPAGLAVVNVAGLIVPQESVANFLGRFVSETPGSLGETVAEQLRVVAQPSPGTLIPDAILVVVALWTVSTAMHHLIRGIQVAAGDTSAGTLLVRTIAVAAAVGAVFALGVLAWALDAATLLGSIGGYAASSLVLTVLTVVMYRVAIGWRETTFRREVVGALVAAAGFVLVALGMEVYAAAAGNLRLIYGTVAGIVVSMLAIWLGLFVILVGAVVNAEVGTRGYDVRASDGTSGGTAADAPDRRAGGTEPGDPPEAAASAGATEEPTDGGQVDPEQRHAE